jgi:hypothetical protein
LPPPRRALWLGTSVPGFNVKWLTNDFKQQVKDGAAPTTSYSVGPLDVLFKRFNQDVRLTDRRLNLTISYLRATQFNWSTGESAAGLRYWQRADFVQVAYMHCVALNLPHVHSSHTPHTLYMCAARIRQTKLIIATLTSSRSSRRSVCTLWPTRAVLTRCLPRRPSTTTHTS